MTPKHAHSAHAHTTYALSMHWGLGGVRDGGFAWMSGYFLTSNIIEPALWPPPSSSSYHTDES